jgi:penicillin-binding protein 2
MSRYTTASPLRTLVFYAVLGLVAVGLIARLFQLQILQGETYVEQAFENRVTRVSDPAPRGVIYDRRGVQLVRNVPSFTVVIIPALLPDDPDPFDDIDPAETQALYRRLAELLDMPVTVPGSKPQLACLPGRGIKDLVDEGAGLSPYAPVKIKCDIDKETAFIIREEQADLPGVQVLVEPLRDYPTGSLTAHLIGYMAPIPDPNEFPLTYAYYTGLGLIAGRDRIGVAGVEASLQDVLAGQNGSRLVEEDVAGKELRTLSVETETRPGLNVQLTIDARLQQAAESALTGRINFINQYFNQIRSSGGVVIAMNPMNGEILAMVSWPTFDNNRFARRIEYETYYKPLSLDPFKPLINHAVSGLYPPGSVFKIVTATGVMEEKVIDPNTELTDPGKITIRNKYFPADPGKAKDFVCWLRTGHGKVNFLRGIAESCDVYFYKVGGGWPDEHVAGLGIDRLSHWMELFGFGEYTGVELPAEARGLIPSSKWKRINYGENWATGDTYNAAIGQGYVIATPLQMMNAINANVNGGTLYQPSLIDKILDGEGNVVTDTQPVVIRQLPISANTLNLIHTGMRQAVTTGTLHGPIGVFAGEEHTPIVDVPGINVAGKTGTAEYCDEIAYPKGLCNPGQWPTHAWTYLYAPYENPEIAVIVFVYNGGEGSKVAAPIADQVLNAYFRLKAADAAQNTAP